MIEDQFQFHIGSIKRIPNLSQDLRKSLFQFHIGSIKSGVAIGVIS